MPSVTVAPSTNSSRAITVVGVPTAKLAPLLGPGAVITRSGEPIDDMAITCRTGPSRLTSMVR